MFDIYISQDKKSSIFIWFVSK